MGEDGDGGKEVGRGNGLDDEDEFQFYGLLSHCSGFC